MCNRKSGHRYGAWNAAPHWTHAEGDALCWKWELDDKHRGATVLYLNPPYDTDREFRRMEEVFLRRYTQALAPKGLLIYVIPATAITASAVTLATHYENLKWFRLPGEEFETFKQVVVFGRLRQSPVDPSPEVVATIKGYALTAADLPELPDDIVCPIPALSHAGFAKTTMHAVDSESLATFGAWYQTGRDQTPTVVKSVFPDPTESLDFRGFTSATPPRPAHIAAAMAAGVFNGCRITPNDPSKGLPDLLVKGQFARKYKVKEEVFNKDGDLTGTVQVQQPELSITVLRLDTYKLVQLTPTAENSGKATVEPGYSVGDLFWDYNQSLLAALTAQCKVLYNPNDPAQVFTIPEMARPLYTAQKHAVRALVTLLGGPSVSIAKRAGKAAILLGELGSGKTSVALATARAVGTRHVLVMCPPHLLDSWRDQAAAVWPELKVIYLLAPKDVDTFFAMTGPVLGVLSREAAKLGSRITAVTGECPRCARPLPTGDLASKRARCKHPVRRPVDILGALYDQVLRWGQGWVSDETLEDHRHLFTAADLRARKIQRAYRAPSGEGAIDKDAIGKHSRMLARKLVKRDDVRAMFEAAIWEVLQRSSLSKRGTASVDVVAAHLLFAVGDPVWARGVLQRAYDKAAGEDAKYLRQRIMGLAVLATTGPDDADVVFDPALGKDGREVASKLWEGLKHGSWIGNGTHYLNARSNGTLEWKTEGVGVKSATPTAILGALNDLAPYARWEEQGPCGEPLYQHSPGTTDTPKGKAATLTGGMRRVPLATYISRRCPKGFDGVLLIDEAHENSTVGTAQEKAAHRLTALRWPSILLTGSWMNGYADSLFAHQWALFPDFREIFPRSAKSQFVDRYGFREKFVPANGKETIKIQGKVTDREESEKDRGVAPGVMPDFLLHHLLPHCVTLQRADFGGEIPPCSEHEVRVTPTPKQAADHKTLMSALLTAVKHDRFDPDLAGALFGQLAEGPSQLDRCTRDTGNDPSGDYIARYPERVREMRPSCDVVAHIAGTDPQVLSPKEVWLLETLAVEFAEGRRVLIFGWHTELFDRFARVIERAFGFRPVVLLADKVPAKKRQEWIQQHVVNVGAPVMIVNPVAVGTGLNNLVHFSTGLFLENPACNPLVVRQARGRLDRIGQNLPVRFYFPVYEGTAQELLQELLQRKIAISMSVDGLNAESALQSVGVGEGYLTSLSVAKTLYAAMIGDAYD